MTVFGRADSSDPSARQNQPRRSEAVSIGDMDTGSASWRAVSSLSDVFSHTLSLRPMPTAGYSDSAVSDRSEPSPPKDPGDGITLPQKILFPSEKICLKWQQTHGVGAGLQNLGNTCFANAALQCLTYTAPLANYMLSHEHSETCHAEGFCMMCIMQDHITQALNNPGDVIKPMFVINEMQRIASHFQIGEQEDAHEFLQHTVDAMQEACLSGSNELDRHSQATTLICQVFGGYLRSRVQCLNCKGVSDTFDPYLDITLEIKGARTINEALAQFVKPEQLDGENCYQCSKCKTMVTASKNFTIHQSSNVLVLSLKRFSNSTGGKIAKDVKYPEYLDIRPFTSQPNGEPIVYTLYAVLVHAGYNCHVGHYLCHVKASNGLWYQMNDSKVSPRDTRSVLNQQAYVLFYIRANDMKTGSEFAKHPTHRRGQSSLHRVTRPRGIANKQAAAGLPEPQLPPHTVKNSPGSKGTRPQKDPSRSSSPSSSGSPRVKRCGPVNITTSVQNWSIPEHPEKQKTTIGIISWLFSKPSLFQCPCTPLNPTHVLSHFIFLMMNEYVKGKLSLEKEGSQRCHEACILRGCFVCKLQMKPLLQDSASVTRLGFSPMGVRTCRGGASSWHCAAQMAPETLSQGAELLRVLQPSTPSFACGPKNPASTLRTTNFPVGTGDRCQRQPAVPAEGFPRASVSPCFPRFKELLALSGNSCCASEAPRGRREPENPPGTGQSPSGDLTVVLEAGSPTAGSPKKLDRMSLCSKFQKALLPAGSSLTPTKEVTPEDSSDKLDESLPMVNNLCHTNKTSTGQDPLPEPCDAVKGTQDCSETIQEYKVLLPSNLQDPSPGDTVEQLSPASSTQPEGGHEPELSVSLSGEQCGDIEAPSWSTGKSADALPSAQPHGTPGPHPDGPRHSHGERCDKDKAGQKAPDRPAFNRKISSLKKTDRGRYCNHRDCSSDGEHMKRNRSRSRSQRRTGGHWHRKRHSYTRKNSKQECHTAVQPRSRSRHPLCCGESVSPSKRCGLGRFSCHHSRTRRGAEQRDRSRYHRSGSDHTWLQKTGDPKKMRWDRYRYYPDRYTPYAGRKPSVKQPHKDSSWARKGREPPARVRERTHFHSPCTGAAPPFPLHPEGHSQEKAAFGAEDSGCGLSDRFYEHKSMKSHKRRYESAKSNDSHKEKKAHRSLLRDLEEPKAKKHKRSKKKKKSKDQRQERDHRHKENKKKKERHSRNSKHSKKEPGLHLLKASSHGNISYFKRLEGSYLLTDGLPMEDTGSFPKKSHVLAYSQGKRRFLELLRKTLPRFLKW
uniref:ubiquitinyl hydrolase 1 n=1 Tax=Cavia porcellus TaxID=10141 RepID=H0WAQ3_CAVPO